MGGIQLRLHQLKRIGPRMNGAQCVNNLRMALTERS